jgi:hypothetical protein
LFDKQKGRIHGVSKMRGMASVALCENLYRNNEAIGEAPVWLGDRKVYPADSSDEPVHGSDKAD